MFSLKLPDIYQTTTSDFIQNSNNMREESSPRYSLQVRDLTITMWLNKTEGQKWQTGGTAQILDYKLSRLN